MKHLLKVSRVLKLCQHDCYIFWLKKHINACCLQGWLIITIDTLAQLCCSICISCSFVKSAELHISNGALRAVQARLKVLYNKKANSRREQVLKAIRKEHRMSGCGTCKACRVKENCGTCKFCLVWLANFLHSLFFITHLVLILLPSAHAACRVVEEAWSVYWPDGTKASEPGFSVIYYSLCIGCLHFSILVSQEGASLTFIMVGCSNCCDWSITSKCLIIWAVFGMVATCNHLSNEILLLQWLPFPMHIREQTCKTCTPYIFSK